MINSESNSIDTSPALSFEDLTACNETFIPTQFPKSTKLPPNRQLAKERGDYTAGYEFAENEACVVAQQLLQSNLIDGVVLFGSAARQEQFPGDLDIAVFVNDELADDFGFIFRRHVLKSTEMESIKKLLNEYNANKLAPKLNILINLLFETYLNTVNHNLNLEPRPVDFIILPKELCYNHIETHYQFKGPQQVMFLEQILTQGKEYYKGYGFADTISSHLVNSSAYEAIESYKRGDFNTLPQYVF